MDESASEPIDRRATRIAQVSGGQRPKQRAVPLVTWIGQTATPSIRRVEDGMSTRLHLLIVDHLIGFGSVLVGWLTDPLVTVSTILVESAMGEKLDLFSEATLLTDRHQIRGFDAPKGMAVKFGFVLLVPGPPLGNADGLHLRLHLVTGVRCDHLVPSVGDVSDLSDILADAPIASSLRILEGLLSAWRLRGDRSQRLPERLGALAERIHQRIERRQDYGATLGHASANCHVDVAIRVGTMGILVAGWLVPDYADAVKEVALVSLFGRRAALDTPLPAKSRPDVLASDIGALARIDCGFAAFAAVEELDRFDAFWFLEVIMAGGAIKRAPFVCPPEPAPLQGIEAAVMLAEERDTNLADLFERAISPAVEWFWTRTRCPGSVSTEMAYGSPPSDARVSVIVPVYGRLDFVRHQIARFSNDPEFRTEAGMVDLIYVLDDPTKADEFSRLCRFLYDVYGVPFRTLIQGRNLGYSAANNAGAAIARGGLLLLLNSDVFPAKPRWVGHLARTYETLDRCGILGCRLLFEDGSIQHAGMSFRTSVMVEGCWENNHPGRGLSVSFDSHAAADPVPAVTGACLMIGRALFDEMGGMSEKYVVADFEDSDLCLRTQEQGLKVYYTPEVELYHLERQSMRLIGHGGVWWRQSLTFYNMWKHSRRWGGVIPKVLKNFGGPTGCEIVDHSPGGCDGRVKDGLVMIPGVDRTETVAQRSTSSPDQRLKNRRPARAAKRSGRGSS